MEFVTPDLRRILFVSDANSVDENGYRKVQRIEFDNLTVSVCGDSFGDIILPNNIIVNADINSIIHIQSPYVRVDFIGGQHEYFSPITGKEKVEASTYFFDLFRNQVQHHFHLAYQRIKRKQHSMINKSLFTDDYMGCAVIDQLEIDLCARHWDLAKLVNAKKEVEQLKGN